MASKEFEERDQDIPPLILNSISQLIDHQDNVLRSEKRVCCSLARNTREKHSLLKMKLVSSQRIHPSICSHRHLHDHNNEDTAIDTVIEEDELSCVDINNEEGSSSTEEGKESSPKTIFPSFVLISCLALTLLLLTVCLGSTLNGFNDGRGMKYSIINFFGSSPEADNRVDSLGRVAALYQSLQDTLADAKLLERPGEEDNEINVLSRVKEAADDIITESDCFKFIGSIEDTAAFSFKVTNQKYKEGMKRANFIRVNGAEKLS